MRLSLLCILPLLSACTQFPELDAQLSATSERADYPELVPIDTLLDGRRLPSTQGARIAESVETRAAALKARANRLRGTVLTAADRARLRERPGT